MRKIILLFMAVLSTAAGHLFAQETLPQWAQDVWDQNTNLIDSVLYYDADPAGPDTRTYVFYYHQPLNHAQPGSEQFPLRALITVFKDTDPTKAVNHVYASGYDIDNLYRPDSAFLTDKGDCETEIAWRYRANHIQLEHRYFRFSAPAECWTRLDDLRAEEAAADFHNLFEALKKVLKGKYVMSGVSKGGTTTLLQHRFYPEDMDIYMPYSAPFFDTDRDLEMQKYFYTTGWNKEYLDMFMNMRVEAINNNEHIYPIYAKMHGGAPTQGKADTLFCYYLYDVANFGYYEHTYSDTSTIRWTLGYNDSIMRAKGVSPYCDTVYAYMLEKQRFSLSDFSEWLDTLRKYPDPKQAPARTLRHIAARPFGITEKEWWTDTVRGQAYEYQCRHELGYYDYRFDQIIEDPAALKTFNDFWVQHAGTVRDLCAPFFSTVTFDPTLYNETMAATQNATRPIVFIYGQDDSWTGAAVKDRFVNGTNVRKFILPAQNHMVTFSSNTDKTQCDAIRSILDSVLGSPQGIDQAMMNEQSSVTSKVIKDGQVFIIRGDKMYTVTGQIVK